MSGKDSADEHDKNIEQWKIKKLIKSLEAARGNGTSMISLIMTPREQVARISKMLSDEFGTASNIKNRVNRLSVLSAITSTQQRLKLYNKVPTNGLVIYCGTIITEDGKERKVNIDFEPFRPINTSLYLCDNKFHTEALAELLENDDKFGFIVMDGNGSLFGVLSGNAREVLHKFTVELPKKHGRGGQSALRFARLRMEKRHNYVRKVAELATQFFISTDKVNVSGIVLAGSADFKNELQSSDLLDQRLFSKVINVVDVSYGGEHGFNQAIDLSMEILQGVKFVQEKKLIQKYFDEISQDTGKYCFGVDDTMKALELGAVETLVVWENLEHNRFILTNPASGSEDVRILTPEQEKTTVFKDETTGEKLDVAEKMPLLEWLANKYKSFGAVLEIVTDRMETWMREAVTSLYNDAVMFPIDSAINQYRMGVGVKEISAPSLLRGWSSTLIGSPLANGIACIVGEKVKDFSEGRLGIKSPAVQPLSIFASGVVGSMIERPFMNVSKQIAEGLPLKASTPLGDKGLGAFAKGVMAAATYDGPFSVLYVMTKSKMKKKLKTVDLKVESVNEGLHNLLIDVTSAITGATAVAAVTSSRDFLSQRLMFGKMIGMSNTQTLKSLFSTKNAISLFKGFCSNAFWRGFHSTAFVLSVHTVLKVEEYWVRKRKEALLLKSKPEK